MCPEWIWTQPLVSRSLAEDLQRQELNPCLPVLFSLCIHTAVKNKCVLLPGNGWNGRSCSDKPDLERHTPQALSQVWKLEQNNNII